MPFDVAFSLPIDERQAFVVALGTLDGGHYDWSSARWGSSFSQTDVPLDAR